MRAPPTALLAILALLLHAPAAADHCSELQARYLADGVRPRAVSVRGAPRGVLLYWGAAPARAAAALLRAALLAVRYADVRLAPGPHRLVDLAAHVAYRPEADYEQLAVAVAAAWAGEAGGGCRSEDEDECWPGGPRLRDFGPSAVPVRARLHARLTRAARARPGCTRAKSWLFYTNATELDTCDFFYDRAARAVLYYLDEDGVRQAADELMKRAATANMLLQYANVTRLQLLEAFWKNDSESFLFLDYDMWKDDPEVRPVETPPCVVVTFECRHELDSSVAIRAVDNNILTSHAPHLYDVLYTFNPSLKSLRAVLEHEAGGASVEEAACQWARDNERQLERWTRFHVSTFRVYVLLCHDDPPEFSAVLNTVWQQYKAPHPDYNLGLMYDPVNCSDPDTLRAIVDKNMQTVGAKRVVGVAARGTAGAVALARSAYTHHLPLVLYDVPSSDMPLGNTFFTSAGHVRPLALTVLYLTAQLGWTRIAVLSDNSWLASDWSQALHDGRDGHNRFALREFRVANALSAVDARRVLAQLREVDGRVVFLNTGPDAATAILSAAVAEGMARDDRYVWILRERPSRARGMLHMTVSYWCRPGAYAAGALYTNMSQLWAGRELPPRAVSLVDAVLTLAYGFLEAVRRQPAVLYDLRTDDHYTEEFARALHRGVGRGVEHELRYEAATRARAELHVCVDAWRGAAREPLGACRVLEDAMTCSLRSPYAGDAPADGARSCVARAGDPFWPQCYDAAWATALVLLALAPPAALAAWRATRRYLARRDREISLRLIARHQQSVEALASYLVSRTTLEHRQELGRGRFGFVHLALMRTPGQRPRMVAAKALREGAAPAEESDFMREACTLAALEHEHVVRLVGVCVDGGPPLVLMEFAFFGDLLRYLRARRPLAEAAPTDSEEAAHVAPEALTRLAREAAAALGYLALRGVVHRDVRAANCLVDARRALKLADFGMARETAAGADGSAEYACRRRALFPVLWMAPESLARGVFSAASDVWALGVLILELVTLGERPYGDMSPLRVLQYVATGGRPPLPQDTAPQTRGVVLACWARDAAQRPSAAELVSYLAEHPRALRAALQAPRADLTDADSGYSEPSSPNLLATDLCLHTLECTISQNR